MNHPVRSWLAVLALLAAGTSASAAPVLRAWSDANALEKAGETRADLDRQRILGCVVPGPTMSRDRLRRFDTELAKLPQNSPERTAYLSVRPMLAQYAAEEGKAPPKATPAPKDLAEALKRAEAWLDKNEPQGMRAFRGSPEAKDALKASQAALEASLMGRHSAALAALITAHRLNPKNAELLVNLAGVLSHYGMHDEALVALAAAEKLPLGEGALGWPVKATLLSNRGYALVKLGRFAEAETALRAASQLAPTLAEAQRNLAQALACQGKTEEALVAARRSVRRTPAEVAKPGTPVPPEAVLETPEPDEDEDEPRETYRPAEYVFDVSRGKKFNLPNLKLPQTPADAVALLPSYKQLLDELRARDRAMSERQQKLEAQIRGRNEPNDLTRERRNLLLSAIYNASKAPRIKPQWRAANKAQLEVSDIWTDFWHCEGGCTIDEIMEKASASSDYNKTFRDLCVPALQSANNSWRGALHGYATELAKAAEATYRLETGLSANYSDAAWHELASIQAEKGALNAFSSVVHLAMIWSQDVNQFKDKCVEGQAPPPALQKVAEEITFDRTASCKDLFGTATLKASFKVVEISVGCETVALKVATPGWIGAYGKAEKNFASGDVTISAGAEAGVTIPFTSSGVKATMGMYVTVDGKGDFKDVGALAEAGATVGMKIDDGKSGLGPKLNGKWSFLPIVDSF